jgi:crotonobetainyl-CoA:carnitine CoA-transferase CaiB-like acyl-CoA transferase
LPQTALIAEVAALFAGQALRYWEDLLAPADCCFETVLDLDGVPDHGQIAARGLVRRSSGPDPLVEVLFPAFLDDAPAHPRPSLRETAAEAVLSLWDGHL